MTTIRCCLALLSLALLTACSVPAEDGPRPNTFQIPAGGGGGY